MLLHELLENKSIFNAINQLEPFPFLEDNASDVFDMMLALEYGERTVFKPFENMTEDQIAKLMVSRFKSTWNNYIKMSILSDDIGSYKIIEEEISGSSDTTSTGTSKNKVSGFNSDDLIDDSGAENNNTEGAINNQTRNSKETESDLSGNYELFAQIAKDKIQVDVMTDVANALTLKIY